VVLPAPHLDDRDFQSLVDDAKRLVQQRSPEWTDHNVSDPGVTLIEAFAQMVDQLIYRLNRVPDRHYVKFLELIGLQLYPATAARGHGDVLARRPRSRRRSWCAPRPRWPTPRTEVDEPVVFTTVADLPIVPCEFSNFAAVTADGGDHRPHPAARGGCRRAGVLGRSRWPGETMLIGLSAAGPVVRGAAAHRLPRRRHRHRPAQPAAGLGGVERLGLERLRRRPRRDRRPEQGRRRRLHVPATPRAVGERAAARRAGCAAGCCRRTA
jgi:hypothetical protein